MRKLLYASLSLVAAMGLTACPSGGGGGGGSSGGGSYGGGTVVSTTWYDVYGTACGDLRPGCSYKDSGYTSDKAMWQSDPYYSYYTDAQYATVWDTDYGYYIDSYGYWGVNGLFYDYYTGRAVNEGATATSKDILTVVGNREEDVIVQSGTAWAAKLDIDAATGVKVARALNDWNKIVKTRARTDADLADFTQRVTGLKMSDIQSAALSNDKAQTDALVDQAAQNWNTSPENMRSILKKIYGVDL